MEFRDAKIVVTGGAGFLGSNFSYRLNELGANVIRVFHNTCNYNGKVKHCWADLTLEQDCKRVVEGVDYVFMCAAETHGAAVIRNNPLSLVTSTIVMNTLTLNACYRAGVKKVLFVSNSVVYQIGRASCRERV